MAKLRLVNRLFLDASYAIALASESDEHHGKAIEISTVIAEKAIPMITTRAVLLEIGNGLARRYRRAAIRLLDSIEDDEDIEVITPSEELYNRALEIYRKHLDKEWGLTDCLSFVVMHDRGVLNSLTADDHFRQAGFTALLLKNNITEAL
jgi:predicted nucleic acid-binding protein